MATHQQLLDAIAAAPNDLAPRLIYADWLEEHGNPLCHNWREPMTPIFRRFNHRDGDGHGKGNGCGSIAGDGVGNGSISFRDGDGVGYGFGFGDNLGGIGDSLGRRNYEGGPGYGFRNGDGRGM